MNSFISLVMQLEFTPHYTEVPIFPNFFAQTIVAAIFIVLLNIAWQLLLKKTTDIEKINNIKKESSELRRELILAVSKQDNAQIADLKKKMAKVNRMNMKIRLQQWVKIVYYFPFYIIWILIAPALFGGIVALSPIHLPFITCSVHHVYVDTQVDEYGFNMGPCRLPGQVYLVGWFLMVNFGISGIISKAIKTPLPGFRQ